MNRIPKGTVIQGPDGQGYRITRDIELYDLVKAADFEAFGGAPEPRGGERMPIWVTRFIGTAKQ